MEIYKSDYINFRIKRAEESLIDAKYLQVSLFCFFAAGNNTLFKIKR
jgi:hypothetical protein